MLFAPQPPPASYSRQVARGKILRVFGRVNTESYLTLTIRDPRNGRPLLTDVASIKAPKEQGDAGQPGDLISWDVRAESGWPRRSN